MNNWKALFFRYYFTSFILAILLCQIPAFSQNLVPNCDFEYFAVCPDSTGQIARTWDWYTPGEGTTDYCNHCADDPVSIPQNIWGNEDAYSGEGYGHIICYYPHMGYDYREYLQVKLLSPLISGEQYDVSFFVSCTENSFVAIDGIGLLFSTDPITQSGGSIINPGMPGNICNPPGTAIMEKTGWKKISGQYLANGGERYITIGNFIPEDELTLIPFPDTNSVYTSFYVDMVSVFGRTEEPINLLPDDMTVCYGESIFVSTPFICGATYLWDDGSSEPYLMIDQPGTYNVFVNADTLSVSDQITISWWPRILGNLPDDTVVCNGATVWLEPGEFSSYSWQDGSNGNIYIADQAGTYWVEISDEHGCLFRDTTVISWLPISALDILHDTILCHGTSILLEPGDYSSYKWQDGSTGKNFLADEAGNYWVEFSGESGCLFRDSLVITWLESIVVDLGGALTLCLGDTILLDAENDGSYTSYIWQDNSMNPYLTVSADGIYTVTVTNPCGSVTDNVQVEFLDCNRLVLVPNAFSPNGDGLNDIFKPSNYLLSAYHMQVFNRWGELIFMTDNPSTGWDGTTNGHPCPGEVYIWLIYYESEATGKLIKQSVNGTVLLLR
jgi:gliding motility-associated-like protein